MGTSPGDGSRPDVVAEAARAIGRAHEELWPMRRSGQPRVPAEVMYERAADAALAVAREAVLSVEPPAADAVGAEVCSAYRDAIIEALGGAR